jgi:hypothetical protein
MTGWAVVLVLLGCAVFFANRSRTRRKRDVFALVAIAMPDAVIEKDTARGHVRGRAVTYALTSRPTGGDSTEEWTEIDVSLAPLAIVMSLRPQGGADEWKIARGLAVDLILGDAPFDGAFVVEAAPETMVREVLDAKIRARLLAMHPAEVTTREGVLRLAKRGWVEAAGAEEAVDLAVTLAAAIEPAFARITEAAMANASSVGYRGAPSGDAVEKALAGAALEVEQVKNVQAARASRALRASAIGIVLFAILVISWTHCSK